MVEGPEEGVIVMLMLFAFGCFMYEESFFLCSFSIGMIEKRCGGTE